MPFASTICDTETAWAAYVPEKETPWDLRRVVHLHRRAGFTATWGEIQRDLKDGPGPSLERLLSGQARSQGVPADFEHVAAQLARRAVADRDAGRLRAWWVYRMLFGPDPLTERLTLLWHNHFATSNEKVRDLAAMHRQNEEFRTLARAPFGRLLDRAARSPALLLWLDAAANRKGHPNENLGREIMELFTLGIGHYTERDVKDAARALTGWSVAEGEFLVDRSQHDDGDKTILGHTGRWSGDDLLRLLLAHPATSERLAGRLCEAFLGEQVVPGAAVKTLAAGLRQRELDVGWAVATILRSQAFFSAANLGSRVQEPVAYVVGAARALELFEPAPSTVALADWAARLDQDLFHPPNVFGWPGGRSWMTPRAAVQRARYALGLVEGAAVGRPRPLDAVALARAHGGRDLDGALTFCSQLLLGRDLTDAWRTRLGKVVGPGPGFDSQTIGRAVAVLLASPEAQVV
jgi:uncharacterized protein (DUF1800 family)